jgi:hypothetical protein
MGDRGRRRRFDRCRRRDPGAGIFADRDSHELGAHRHRLPDLAAERDDPACHRRRNLDTCLVGHHVGERLIFGHGIALADVPGDELDLGDPLANVGHLDHADGHQSSIALRNARPSRAGPGK